MGMIANARMYSVSPDVGALWRSLLSDVIAKAGLPMTVIEHPAPAPLAELWSRPDQGAVFMCGLPFSHANPRPVLVAAPVPSPPEFGDRPEYWSEFVVRESSDFRSIEDTFGKRIAFTVPDSQSGCVAALSYFMSLRGASDASSTGNGSPSTDAVPSPTGPSSTGRGSRSADAVPSSTDPSSTGRGSPSTDAVPSPTDPSSTGRGSPSTDAVPPSTDPSSESTRRASRPADPVRSPSNPEAPLFSQIVAPTITPLGALTAVIDGAAEVAPIDAYALRLLQRYRPDLTSQVRIVGRTVATPIPPLVASTEEPRLVSAFLEAGQIDSIRPLMEKLLLRGFARPDPAVYEVLSNRFAAATQYWRKHPLAAVTHPRFVL